MKSYCTIMLLCMQVTVLFGAQLGVPTKDGRRRSPVRPAEKTHTTSDRSAPTNLKKSVEISVPISLTKSGEMRLQSQAKSPSQAITPGDYFFWASDQGCSPSFHD